MARIVIVGSGVVGSATGRGLAQRGHAVTFVDILPSRVQALRSEGFDAQLELSLPDEEPCFVFLTLPTPHVVVPGTSPEDPPERRYDLSAFFTGVRDVARAIAASPGVHTVVVRSTVPPTTTTRAVLPLLEELSGKREGVGFTLASNPEFLRAASADEDFRHPWLTVIGTRSRRTGERLADLLRPFGGELRVFEDPTTAETVKIVNNVYNAAKISFYNEIWALCNALGVSSTDVASTVARSAEGSWNIEYGIRGGAPYGGMCLPKDTNGLLGLAASLGISMPMLQATVTVNELLESELDGQRWQHELAARSGLGDDGSGSTTVAEAARTQQVGAAR